MVEMYTTRKEMFGSKWIVLCKSCGEAWGWQGEPYRIRCTRKEPKDVSKLPRVKAHSLSDSHQRSINLNIHRIESQLDFINKKLKPGNLNHYEPVMKCCNERLELYKKSLIQ